jgi:hypothetical protein
MLGLRKVRPKEEIMKRQASNTAVTARRAAKFMFGAAAVLTMSVLQTPAQAQALSSFNDSVGEHVVFIGEDAHVHQTFCGLPLPCNNGTNWNQMDLTRMTNGPTNGPSASSPYPRLASYADSHGEHVFATDANNNVYQFFSTDGRSWRSESLGVQDVGGMSGYSATSTTTTDYLFYETSNQHVHMLASSNGTSFGDTDLSAASGATSILAQYGTTFASFHDADGEHVFYEGTDHHLYEISSSWQYFTICGTFGCRAYPFLSSVNQDLTNQTNGTLVARIGTSLIDATGESVFYLGRDSHLHEAQNSSGAWFELDLTLAARGALPYASLQEGPAPTSLSNPLGRQLFFLGSDLNVHDYLLGTNEDLTTLAKAPLVYACAGAASTGFTDASTPGQVESVVFYVANDGSVHKLSQVGYAVPLSGTRRGTAWLIADWTDLNVIPYSSDIHPMNYFCS